VGARAPAHEVVVRAFAHVWLPLAISALTTVIGFGSLMVNRFTATWDLGDFAVIGVARRDDVWVVDGPLAAPPSEPWTFSRNLPGGMKPLHQSIRDQRDGRREAMC
jgi:hypothetical protein